MQDHEYQDRPKDGIHLMDTAISIVAGAFLAFVAATVAYVSGLQVDLDSAQVIAAQVAAVDEKRDIAPCDFTATSYGHYHQRKEPECVGKGGPLPNHILTLPVEVQQ